MISLQRLYTILERFIEKHSKIAMELRESAAD
jgi:hypothetical protein